MADEKIFLKWNHFSDATTAAFSNLGTNKEFSDVTLASGDGQMMQAHRLVLSVSSPVLREILLKIPHHHQTLLYMRGITMEDLDLILKFLYFGEVEICQKNLENFLEIANELKIEGLTRNESVAEHEYEDGKSESNNKKIEDFALNTEEPINTEFWKPAVDRTDENSCDQCGQEYKSGKALMRHRKDEHPGKSFSCNECQKEFATNANLKIHKKSIHEKIRQPCEVCDKDFANPSSLFVHKKTQHTI